MTNQGISGKTQPMPKALEAFEPVAMYFVAFVFLVWGLAVDHKRRHPRASEVGESSTRCGDIRRADPVQGADILFFGAIVAIVVHLITLAFPVANALISKDEDEMRLKAVVLYTACFIVPIVLINVYKLYATWSRRRDVAIINLTIRALDTDAAHVKRVLERMNSQRVVLEAGVAATPHQWTDLQDARRREREQKTHVLIEMEIARYRSRLTALFYLFALLLWLLGGYGVLTLLTWEPEIWR